VIALYILFCAVVSIVATLMSARLHHTNQGISGSA
jgi:hypothetical protein